jgi:CubicO group peptidase (beta-lactamase class C family)
MLQSRFCDDGINAALCDTVLRCIYAAKYIFLTTTQEVINMFLFDLSSPKRLAAGKALLAVCAATIILSATGIASAQNPTQDGASAAPDAWLFEREGRPWWYRSVPSPKPVELKRREPTAAEQPVVDRVKSLMASRSARAFALLDGDTVVHQQFNAPANEDSVIFGFSMGKTVTAMAVGQAICAGKLKYETKANELVPQLNGKALGNATVRDLLRMASGSTESNPDSSVWSPEQAKAWGQGNLSLVDLVIDDRVARAQRGVFSEYKPGEATSYKSTDPILLAIMTAKATGAPWGQWIQQSTLNPMGASKTGLYVQDRQGNGLADSGMRMRMEDWQRFALWVKRSSTETGCWGDFVREAFKPQIKNGSSPADRKFGKLFASYGFFTWLDNSIAPNTVWANGWGGQRIGWSTDPANNRIVITFSNVESWMPEVYEVARDWMRVR